MGRYLSLDTEATGLEVDCYLIQVALVPVDGTSKTLLSEWGKEVLIQCPSFEELKPKLNPWVLEHNEKLIKMGFPQLLLKNGLRTISIHRK
jgi:DNA polymerase-3 subunit epsilon